MGASTVLAFDILARDRASKEFEKVGRAAQATGDRGKDFSKAFKGAMLGAAGAAVGFSVVSIKAAGDFQQSLTELVTGAGESEKNIGLVGKGMLKMAGQVGISAIDLSKGMYMVESAGYHGAAGLSVLRAAAEGARVGGADMATVADGLTTALNDYHLPASQAAAVTSKLVATVAAGKTHMEDLAGSLAMVLPAASAAHVGLSQVLGALATMTSEGTPAADAATYLRQTILQLSNPSKAAATEMKGLGLSAIDVSSHLGERGLTGTLNLLTGAIRAKMGPAGTVVIETLTKASGSSSKFHAALKQLTPEQQTFVGSLAKMVGGTKSMQAALELTGAGAATFARNVKTIGGTTTEAGGHVKGFALTQKDLNTKIDNLKAAFGTLEIEVGQKLVPVIMAAITWFTKHKDVAKALAITIGTTLAGAFAISAAKMAISTVQMGLFAARVILLNGSVAAAIGMQYAAAAASAVWTAAQWALNIALDANPIGLIVVGIAALIGVIVLAYTHSKTFRDIVHEAFHAVAVAGEFMWGVIKAVFQGWVIQVRVVAAAGTWLWHSVLQPAFHGIATAAQFMWGVIKAVFSVLTLQFRAFAAVADFIKGHWSGFVSFMASIPGKILGFFAGIPGKFLQIGSSIIDGLVSGVKGAWHKVSDAIGGLAGGLPGVVKHVLGINSPARVMIPLGSAIPEGLAAGVDKGRHHASDAVKRMVEAVKKEAAAAMRESKQLQALGHHFGQAFLLALQGSPARIQSAVAAAIDKIVAGPEGPTAERRAVEVLQRDQPVLLRLANERVAIATRLKNAQAALQNAIKAKAQFVQTARDNVLQFADITGLVSGSGNNVDISSIITGMQDKLNTILQFRTNLALLAKRHLSQSILQQIIAAGVDKGGATAQALVAGAGPAQIAQINALQASIAKGADAVGATAGSVMSDAGIKAAQGLVKGLQKQENAIAAQMLRIALLMERAIKKALGIRSPSRVFHLIGEQIPLGMAQGITSRSHLVEDAVVGLGSRRPRVGVTTPTAGTGAVVYNINVTGAVDRRGTAKEIQSMLLELQNSTGRALFPAARRA